MGDVISHTADYGFLRENHRFFCFGHFGRIQTGNQSASRTFHITFDPSHLPSKKDIFALFGSIGLFQELRRIHEAIAMHNAIADKLSVFQARNHLEDALLFPPFQMGLEPYNIVQRSRRIVLAKLNHRVRPFIGFRIFQAHGFHGTKKHRFGTSGCHDFNGHTAFKVFFFFEFF